MIKMPALECVQPEFWSHLCSSIHQYYPGPYLEKHLWIWSQIIMKQSASTVGKCSQAFVYCIFMKHIQWLNLGAYLLNTMKIHWYKDMFIF